MKSNAQLTQDERYQIYAFHKAGFSQTEIADELGRHKSTICRELKRNKGLRGYRPDQAQRMADNRKKEKVQTSIPAEVWRWVKKLTLEDWSPEQVSGWLSKEKLGSVSPEWIYQYIYADKHSGGDLHSHLRCQKARKKRYGSYDRRGQIKERVSIEDRPAIVDKRSRVGDWEVDTVIGKQGGTVLVTVAERKSRFSVIALATNKTADAVTEALVLSLESHADRVHTLTYDNGKEFAFHQAVSEQLDADSYFAHPYHSWERGLNENMNGLIRQYLPKGMCFQELTQKDITTIMKKLNDRPRKCLGYKTPNEVFLGIKPPVALAS